MKKELLNLPYTEETLNIIYNHKGSEYRLKKDLDLFIKTIHYQHFHTDYIFKDFHIKLTSYLNKYINDLSNTKHLIINIPVRCGKSQIVVHFIKWLLYNEPTKNIIYTSYNKGLVLKYSKEIRDDLQSKLIGYDIEEDTKSKENWKIKGKGEFLAKTFNSGLTGRGADFIVIDDPLDANNYNSKAEKENVIDTYESVIKSRLDNKLTGRFILIMQRLAVDDLTNYLLETYPNDWDLIKIPALNENNQSIFEEKLPTSFLLKEKEYNNFNFNSQYQQEPILAGGNVIKQEWFKSYDILPQLKQVYITGDTAFKTKESNDYSVFQLWGKDNFGTDANYYLIDMIRGKWESPELLDVLRNFYEKWKSKYKIHCLHIEDKASGIGLIQQIRRLSIPVKEFKIDRKMKDKFTRLMDVLPRIASGYVYLPTTAPWKLDFINECCEFRQDMSHKHDDQCFIAGTKIKTIRGDVNIENIKKGDVVITPFGLSKVIEAGQTGISDVIYNKELNLYGTPRHKILDKNKRYTILKASRINNCIKWNLKNLLIWQIKWNILLMVYYIKGWVEKRLMAREVISTLIIKPTKKELVENLYTWQCGNITIREKLEKVFKYIIKTAIHLTTIPIIYYYLQLKNIVDYIQNRVIIQLKKLRNILTKYGILRVSGINQKREKSGIDNTLKTHLENSKELKNQKSWLKKVEIHLLKTLNPIKRKEYVKDVEKSLYIATTQDFILEKTNMDLQTNIANNVKNTSQIKLEKRAVYNLKTMHGCYFANNILVSNCDAMVIALNQQVNYTLQDFI